MEYPPTGFDQWLLNGGSLNIVNGRAAYSEDARRVDEYATWLACYKRALPSSIGRPYYSGTTWYMRSRLPQYTAQMGVRFLACGVGSISCTVDGNAQSITVQNGNGASNTLAGASWIQMPELYDVTSSASRADVDWSFTITDGGAPLTLVVYTVRPFLVRPSGAEALP